MLFIFRKNSRPVAAAPHIENGARRQVDHLSAAAEPRRVDTLQAGRPGDRQPHQSGGAPAGL